MNEKQSDANRGAIRPTIQVIERMFDLLDVLASQPDPVSLKQLTERTGLHPSTAHRILNDLAIGRYVDRPEAGSYRLGMRLLELGNLVKARLDVRDAALAPMRELHKLTHQPVNLSVRQGDEIVYIERTYSERSGMQVVRAVGGRAPLHLTSVGKLFLAYDDPQRVRAYATRTGLAGHTRNSITDSAQAGARAVAGAPIRGGARRRRAGAGRALLGRRHLRRPVKLVAGLSVSAPADRLEESLARTCPSHCGPDLARPSGTVADWPPAVAGVVDRRRARSASASSQRRMRSASPMRE